MRFRCQGPSLAVQTPAKLNLSLEVLGRRPDGYHELETVMVSIGLYDTLLFTEDGSHQTRLTCRDAGGLTRSDVPRFSLSSGPENLVFRAAELLRSETETTAGVAIQLWKRIPMQAGLGGGSSDAAATLVGLNRLWRTGLSSSQLHRLAAQLGSDVNFFLDSHLAALCRGRGEQVTPLKMNRRRHFVVVCPDTGVSTGEVFGRLGEQRGPKSRTALLLDRLNSRQPLRPQHLQNDLQQAACQMNPEIAATIDRLNRAGGQLLSMSGSGSSCYAVCRTRDEARRLAAVVGRHQAGRTFLVSQQV